MALLIAGVVLWSIVHLVPSAAPGVRAGLASKFGEGAFKALFAIDIVIALVLIVFGWKSAQPVALYVPPLYGSPVPSILLLISVLLFVASSVPNNLRRFVRHPQMTAVLFWSAGHILTNGDSRSLVLFGGLALWALLEIIFINRRDGRWQKPDPVPFLQDLMSLVVTGVVFAALLYFHATLFGVPAMPA